MIYLEVLEQVLYKKVNVMHNQEMLVMNGCFSDMMGCQQVPKNVLYSCLMQL